MLSLGAFNLQMLMLETVDRPIMPLLHQLPTPEQSRAASCTGTTTSLLECHSATLVTIGKKIKKRKKKPIHFSVQFFFIIIVVLI